MATCPAFSHLTVTDTATPGHYTPYNSGAVLIHPKLWVAGHVQCYNGGVMQDIEDGQWLLLQFVGNLIHTLNHATLPVEITDKYKSQADEIRRQTMLASSLDQVHKHHESYHRLISNLLGERLKYELSRKQL